MFCGCSISRARSSPAAITRRASSSDTVPCEVMVVVALGEQGDGARLLSRMTLKSWTELALAEGQSVYAQVKYVSLNPGRGEPEQ